MYERVQDTLGARIPTPDLTVYLHADVENLMTRIAVRDRSYERTMEREYIADLARRTKPIMPIILPRPSCRIETDTLDYVTATTICSAWRT